MSFTVNNHIFNIYKYFDNSKIPQVNTQIDTLDDPTVSDAGLKIPKDYIIVDIDDEKVALRVFEILNKYTFWVKTSRGYHFYFTIPEFRMFKAGDTNPFKAGAYTLTGIKVDYKKNIPFFNNGEEHTEFVKIKDDGKIREYSTTNDIIPLPEWLYPLPIVNNKYDRDNDIYDILHIPNGTRHNKLVSYAGIISKSIPKFYNNADFVGSRILEFVVGHCLETPLEYKELENILATFRKFLLGDVAKDPITRVQSISQNENFLTNAKHNGIGTGISSTQLSIFSRNVMMQFQTAIVNHLMSNFSIVYYQKDLYIKDKDCSNVAYIKIEDDIVMGEILEAVGVQVVNKNFSSNIKYLLSLKAYKVTEESTTVIFKNGFVLNQDTGDIHKYNNEFSTIIIDCDYIPPKDEYSDEEIYYRNEVDKFIEFISKGGLHDNLYEINESDTVEQVALKREIASKDAKDVEQNINEMLGHILMIKHQPQYAYFLTGKSGRNGKSTFIEMIQNFIGINNTSTNSLQEFEGDYSLSTMVNKLLNIGDDINNTIIESAREFKTIVTNNPITIRGIYESPKTVKLFSTLIFTCNELPKFKTQDGGVTRRIKIIPLHKSVPENEVNNQLIQILSHPFAKQRLLERALIGFKSIRANNSNIKFANVIERETEDYFLKGNSLTGFIKESFYKNNDLRNDLTKSLKTKLYETICNIIKSKDNNVSSVYEAYTEYCADDGIKYVMAKNKFRDEISYMFNIQFKYIGERCVFEIPKIN